MGPSKTTGPRPANRPDGFGITNNKRIVRIRVPRHCAASNRREVGHSYSGGDGVLASPPTRRTRCAGFTSNTDRAATPSGWSAVNRGDTAVTAPVAHRPSSTAEFHVKQREGKADDTGAADAATAGGPPPPTGAPVEQRHPSRAGAPHRKQQLPGEHSPAEGAVGQPGGLVQHAEPRRTAKMRCVERLEGTDLDVIRLAVGAAPRGPNR